MIERSVLTRLLVFLDPGDILLVRFLHLDIGDPDRECSLVLDLSGSQYKGTLFQFFTALLSGRYIGAISAPLGDQ